MKWLAIGRETVEKLEEIAERLSAMPSSRLVPEVGPTSKSNELEASSDRCRGCSGTCEGSCSGNCDGTCIIM